MNLIKLGWNNFFEENFKSYKEKNYYAGRVCVEQKSSYKIYTEVGIVTGEISGKLRYESDNSEILPAVGDWVVISLLENEKKALIHKVLPRKSKFSRKCAGITCEEQITAANIDTVFIVVALNKDFNVRRIERYLITAWDSGATPVIVLSKADLCDNIDEKINMLEISCAGVPVHTISIVESLGLNELDRYFTPGCTTALLGSSGVGKSTLTNYLMGKDVQKVKEIRECDGKGKHTSTFREMFILPNKSLLIDTPGMREMQLWDGNEGIYETFNDIEELAYKCKFRNCKHENEPGCAVKKAIENGELGSYRFNSYVKLQKELKYIENRQKFKAKKANKK